MIPKFEMKQVTIAFTRNIKIDVSKYTEIMLVDSHEVHSNPDFEHALVMPLFNGKCYYYPHDLGKYKYYLNDIEIELPDDTIEHFYTELYKMLHKEYINALVEEL